MNASERTRRVLKAVPRLIAQPPWAAPGHFYSPLTSAGDVRRALTQGSPPNAVDLDAEEQARLATRLAPMCREWLAAHRPARENNMFGAADAAIYSAMLRLLAPARVVEVGSGYSSAVALATAEEFGVELSLTCIEPNPDRLDRALGGLGRRSVTVRREPVQDTPRAVFSGLSAGDVLFIDSAHVVKAGSDVEHLLFRVLPELGPGVVVHVHDMFWPWQYPERWLREHRDWNELYVVHALLSYTPAWRILLFADWLWRERPALAARLTPGLGSQRPGSLWLRRTAS